MMKWQPRILLLIYPHREIFALQRREISVSFIMRNFDFWFQCEANSSREIYLEPKTSLGTLPIKFKCDIVHVDIFRSSP